MSRKGTSMSASLVTGCICLVRAPKHTGPSYKPYCMPSLTVALLLLEWLHDGVYAGRCCARDTQTQTHRQAPESLFTDVGQ